MGGVLDSARMRTFIALELGINPAEVEAMVLGGHGDLMVPLIGMATANGKAVTELLSEATLNGIIKRTRNGGAEIVGLLRTGSAYYAPAASTVEMIETILGMKNAVLPCSVYLNGEYGIKGVYSGVPVKLDSGGLAKVVEYQLGEEDMNALKASADAVRGLITKLDL
jgi:malate dehydrogenase